MKYLLTILAVLMSTFGASAFSLRGPLEPWMTTDLDYARQGDVGGPMALGNEYRWNLPIMTYGFDQSFLDHFGGRGVQAVEEAIVILNALPPASELDVDAFAPATRRVNFEAQTMGLLDLKSAALALVVKHLGLAEPQDYVWTLRSKTVSNGVTNYTVIQRNFDPATLLPSSSINGTAFEYQIVEPRDVDGTSFASAAVFPLDPFAWTDTAVAQFESGRFSFNSHKFTVGDFYTGLTRDDVGGLRYLYHPTNVNVEPLPAGVIVAPGNSRTVVDVAPRPGVDKIRFSRVEWDTNRMGFQVTTNLFTDTFLSDGVPMQQTLQRVSDQPDIVFRARDLGIRLYPDPFTGGYTATPSLMYKIGGVSEWSNNAAMNGRPNGAGPGTIPGRRTIDFTTQAGRLGQLSSAAHWLPPIFGSFDGSTNGPVAYGNEIATSVTIEARKTNDFFVWKILGTHQAVYRIDSSTNLVHWTPMTTVTNSAGHFSVTNSTTEPRMFYRAVRISVPWE